VERKDNAIYFRLYSSSFGSSFPSPSLSLSRSPSFPLSPLSLSLTSRAPYGPAGADENFRVFFLFLSPFSLHLFPAARFSLGLYPRRLRKPIPEPVDEGVLMWAGPRAR
jgi:hypothetical protein